MMQKIPILPDVNVKLVDENNLMTQEWHDFFDNLINALRNNQNTNNE